MFQKSEINNCLLNSLIELLIFLEFSDEEMVNPDAAIRAFEQLSIRLLELSDSEKSSFLYECKKISLQYRGAEADFIANIGESLGLE